LILEQKAWEIVSDTSASFGEKYAVWVTTNIIKT
jgi:hypothetical protein